MTTPKPYEATDADLDAIAAERVERAMVATVQQANAIAAVRTPRPSLAEHEAQDELVALQLRGTAYRLQRDEARAEVEKLEKRNALLRGGIGGWRSRARSAEVEVERLQAILGDSRCGDVPALVRSWTDQSAALARIAILSDEWEGADLGDPTNVPWPVAESLMHKAATDLRALLAPPTTSNEAPCSDSAGLSGSGGTQGGSEAQEPSCGGEACEMAGFCQARVTCDD